MKCPKNTILQDVYSKGFLTLKIKSGKIEEEEQFY